MYATVISNIREEVDIFISTLLDNSAFYRDDIILGEYFNSQQTRSLVQKLVYLGGTETFTRVLKPVILSESIRAEKISSSGDLTLIFSSFLIRNLLKSENISSIKNNLNKNDINNILNDIGKIGFHADKKSIESLLENEISDGGIKLIIQEAIRLAGASSSIFVERSESEFTKIELKEGFSFPIKVNENFLPASQLWNRKNVKIVIIDGAILEPSEIHHLLLKASQTKEPYLVFCRDIEPDVLNTIYVNNHKNIFDVMPVSVGMSEETVNILNDISIISNSPIISSYTGDLISSSVKRDFPAVSEVKINKSEINIFSKKSDEIRKHVEYLKFKKNNCRDEKVKNLINQRIRSLSTGQVKVNVGKRITDHHPLGIEMIDSFLRLFSHQISFGYVKRKDVLNFLNNYKSKTLYEKSIIDSLLASIEKLPRANLISFLSLCTACNIGLSIARSIISTERIVLLDSPVNF